MPLMLLLMVNVWDFGRAFFISLNLTDAAYQGARLASHSNRSNADIASAIQTAAPNLDASGMQVTISRPSAAGQAATITVTYPFIPTASGFSAWVFGNSITRQASEIVR